MIDHSQIWPVIIGLGIGSYILRFFFLGIIGDRPLPPWVLRHLRYTAVAILPGLVAPLVVWPQATAGVMDPPRMIAALVTLGVGLWTRNVFAAVGAGAATLVILLNLFA